MYELEEDEPEAFRVTPGFIAFVSVLCLPVIAALAIFLGAWLVSAEVQAAEASAPPSDGSSFATSQANDVAGWKKSLVGICPLH
jgi:hypothetical protein